MASATMVDLLQHAVLQYRLLAADLLQGHFAAVVVELLEAVEAVAPGLADIAELLGEHQQANLRARMIFGSVVMVSSGAPLRALPRLAIRRLHPTIPLAMRGRSIDQIKFYLTHAPGDFDNNPRRC